MQNSAPLDLPTPLALVCHDAGAANLIFAWMHAHVALAPDVAGDWRLLALGPAEGLWSARSLPQVRLCRTIDEVLEGAEVLVSGTGWASDIEYDSIRTARRLGIKSIAVIDHWTNYRQRFIRNNIEELPDQIWVADEYAKRMAESEFADIDVIQKPNLFLENLVQEIQSYKHEKNRAGGHVLYVLEPIRHAWGEGIVNGEFQALDFFINNLEMLGLDGDLSIRLRPHPSDPSGKYDQWIDAQKHLKVALDNSATLVDSIAWSDVVVGCQTYAMVIALAAGKRVFSSIPPWAPPCILPQKGIARLSDLV